MSPEGKGPKQFTPEQEKPAASLAKTADQLKKELLSKEMLGVIKKIINQKYPGIQETEQDDIVQKVRIAVLRNIENGHFEGRADLSTYVYRAVINAAIAFNKERQKRYPLELDLSEFNAADTTTINEIAGRIDKEYLQYLISQLPPRMRQIIELKLQDRDQNDIAKELGIAVGTVKSMFFKALRNLRKIIAADAKKNKL